MSKIEKKLKELESKLDSLSRMLENSRDLLQDEHIAVGKLMTDISKSIVH